MTEHSLPPWKHALLGCLYGAGISAILLVGGYDDRNAPAPMVLFLAAFSPLLFAGLAGIYGREFWDRALFRHRDTRRRMLGWLLGIILILLLFRFL